MDDASRLSDRILDAAQPLSRLADIGERLDAVARDFKAQLGALTHHVAELARLIGDEGGDHE